MTERGKLKRLHVVSYVKVTHQLTDGTVGHLIDITTEGVRLCGDQPVMPVTRYRFKMTLPGMPGNRYEICFEVDVIRRVKDTIFNIYDVGVQHVSFSAQELKLTEDFIWKATFEERWSTGIESRPEYSD